MLTVKLFIPARFVKSLISEILISHFQIEDLNHFMKRIILKPEKKEKFYLNTFKNIT